MTRADETRRRLLVQGRLAFAAKGHDGVSLQRDVLEPSGVSNGSFYHQFEDKTDLLVAVLDDAARAGLFVLHASIAATPTGDRNERARRAFETWFDMVDGAEDLFRIQLRERENSDPRVRALIRELRQGWVVSIADALRGQAASPSVDPDLAAQLVASLAYGILADYLDAPPKEREALRTALADALPKFVAGGVAGLGTPP